MSADAKISVIVPVYNAGRYLGKTLQSIASQTFSDIEVIVINDGSTDDSIAIIEDFQKQDSRFRLINKNNEGVSSARNLGIDKATGDWLYFCDADDEILPDGLETLFSTIDDETDLATCEHITCNADGEEYIPALQTSAEIERLTYAKYLFGGLNGRYQGYLWNKLFKRSIIVARQIRFDTAISYNEDRLFIMSYLCNMTHNVKYNLIPVYKYYLRGSSAMGRMDSLSGYKLFESDLDAFIRCREESAIFNSEELVNLIQWSAYISWRRNRTLIKKYSGDIQSDLDRITSKLYSICPKYKRFCFDLKICRRALGKHIRLFQKA